jgi:hypothetical protein
VGDVIVKLGDEEIESAEDLLRTFESLKWMGGVMAKVVRNQQELELAIGFK